MRDTGTFLLVGAGLALGRRITTHHDFIHDLLATGGSDLVEGVRFVRDGNVVTAGGVMSGIEMSLWLVERLYGADLANPLNLRAESLGFPRCPLCQDNHR